MNMSGWMHGNLRSLPDRNLGNVTDFRNLGYAFDCEDQRLIMSLIKTLGTPVWGDLSLCGWCWVGFRAYMYLINWNLSNR
jgi:hypothetical protein